MLSRQGGGAAKGIESDTGLERWHSSLELFHRTSGERGYVLYPASPSSRARSGLVLEYGSSF